MRALLLCASIASLAVVAPAAFAADVSMDVRVRIGSAPPPPVVVYDDTPELVVVPNTTVYVVAGKRHDYDYFRYGVYWYIYRGDHWYRARSYRGPFTVVEAKYVPRAIVNVPPRYWKHHPHGGPPGQVKKAVGAQTGAAVVKGPAKPAGKHKGKGRDR